MWERRWSEALIRGFLAVAAFVVFGSSARWLLTLAFAMLLSFAAWVWKAWRKNQADPSLSQPHP